MNILIVEDEQLAAERLRLMIEQVRGEVEIVAELELVSDAVSWFGEHSAPDLAFFDIQLGDGLSFEIFEQVEVPCPVIFTTAYDQYALQAFKVHSVDYLLKPVKQADLEAAFAQYDKLAPQQKASPTAAVDMQQLMTTLQQLQQPVRHKQRYVVDVGDKMQIVPTTEVAFFYYEHRSSWLRSLGGRKYALDRTLDEIAEEVDPAQFFRINRQYIISVAGIKQIHTYSNSRLQVELLDGTAPVVSRERVKEFRAWLSS